MSKELVKVEQMPLRIVKNIDYRKNVWGDLIKVSETNTLEYFWNGEWTKVPVELEETNRTAEQVDAVGITV